MSQGICLDEFPGWCQREVPGWMRQIVRREPRTPCNCPWFVAGSLAIFWAHSQVEAGPENMNRVTAVRGSKALAFFFCEKATNGGWLA